MIELQHLTKRFATQGGTVIALNDINLTIRDGDVYGIIGMSGAGKSTLVRCINMLERPDEGKVIVNGKQMQELNAADLRAARREITMIFQQFNLLMQRTCLRNIMFPMELAKVPRDKAEARARELLELVGLPDKADAYPAQLSGGQKQRIAIARALATDPKVLLCDEATSALDPNTTHAILQLIQKINRELGITVVIPDERGRGGLQPRGHSGQRHSRGGGRGTGHLQPPHLQGGTAARLPCRCTSGGAAARPQAGACGVRRYPDHR